MKPWITLAFAAALMAGCAPPDDAASQDAGIDTDFELDGDAAAGAAPYARFCASCHGADGRGDGPAARALRPPVPDFTAVEIPAERAYRIVRGGGMAAGMAATMPAFERLLSDQDIHDVVAYILSLNENT